MTTKKKHLSTLLATTAIAGAGLGLTLYAFAAVGEQKEALAAARPAPAAMAVEIAVTESKPVRLWAEFSARLQAVDSVALRPQVSGAVTDIRFADGQRVQKGDVLFVIDPRPYQSAVTLAKAELAATRQRTDFAGKELERARSLIQTSAIAQKTLDERANAFRVSRSEVEAAEARLTRAEIDLDHAFVKAPIAGRASRAEITQGNLVQAGAGAPVLTTIVADQEIYADFDVDEQTYLQFVHGSARNLELERAIPVKLEIGSASVEGHIYTFDNKINPSTGTIRARALFANGEANLLPGMFARVKLGSAEQQPAVLLSDKAVLTDQNRRFVYVIDGQNKAAYRQVAVGATIGSMRVIADGLEAGDRVIVSNLMSLRPGVPVTPKQVSNTSPQ